MCSKNAWGEVSTLNLPGWQHMVFFEREHGIQSPLLVIKIILCLQTAIAAFEGGSRGIVIRICSLRTPEGRSVLWTIHAGGQHMILFKKKNWVSLFAQEQTVRCLGPPGAARAAQLCCDEGTSIYRPNTQRQRRHMSLPEIFQSLVVLLRPTESDYCRVPKLASPPPRKLQLLESEANFRTFPVIPESNSHFWDIPCFGHLWRNMWMGTYILTARYQDKQGVDRNEFGFREED